jgi:carboxymethylenebutenolidase
MFWNSFSTDMLGGIVARAELITGGGGDTIHAYIARPDGDGPYPGVVLVPHAPGWDEFLRETSRRFAEHGFIAICPNIFERFGHGTPGDVVGLVRAMGGVSDDSVVADSEAALQWVKAQPTSNGNVGVIGMCSAGRHATLVASRVQGFGAVADLWGAEVVMAPDRLTPNTPVAVIDLTPQLNVPILGLFGNDDRSPSPAQVDEHEAALLANGKTYFFYRYDGAGHGFFYYDRINYRPQAAMDGWEKVLTFFTQYLVPGAGTEG